MDPNETLKTIIDAAVAGDPETLTEAAEDLADWFGGTGFTPDDPRLKTGELEELLAAFKADPSVLTMSELSEALGAYYRRTPHFVRPVEPQSIRADLESPEITDEAHR